jgi:hypothetical protein
MVLPTFVAQIALATACLRPARLRIDDDGIAVRDRGTQQHLPWPVIAEVGLVPHATRIFWKAAITIRLHDNPESPHVLLGLHRLRTSKEAVERALRHHAGTAWNPDLHTDTGLRHNDDSAVVASGRYSGPLTHALGFLGLILFMVQTFLADPAQQTNSPVLVATAAFCYISELIMIIFMPVLALFADPLTVTVSRTGISIRRWPLAKTIPWTSVRHIAIEDGALLVWPSADTAKTRRNPFRGLPDQGGGVVLCRLNERREHLNVSAVTLDQALARFAGPRHLPRFSSPQSRARLQ